MGKSPVDTSELRSTKILWLLLGLALLIRLFGIGYGLPYVYWIDEYHEVMRAMELGAGEFNLTRTGKGGFYFLLFFEYGVYFVVLKVAGLVSNAQAFAEHFRPDQSVATFANLGGDAVLVAPSPADGGDNYSHLASFVATAPASQQDALWKAVGEACNRRIGTKPVWISTAGLGVGWLHVRLDDRPKYYRHTPYMSVPAVLVHP